MEVILTAWAEECLKDVYRYYCEKAGPKKAFEIVNRIIDRVESLEKYPNRGRVEEDLTKLKKGHRFLLEYHYKIIYRVERGRVIVTDIFSSRQDPARKLGRNK
ncbi:MAG: type II toxin-antitoxin system RelE/ParE family toxin [Anditalea sp.]